MSATHEALIVKAALRYNEDSSDARYKYLVRTTRLNAFAQVAADVLGIAMTPWQFEMALKHALEQVPLPQGQMANADKAQLLRSEWRTNFLANFYNTLEMMK